MKNKKSAASSMILGVAFVWFTTHFGGGFASGAQIYSYYVRYGIWCLLMPVLAMGYNAVYNTFRRWICLGCADLQLICVMCVAPAVAFATGGATLSTLTGLPYLLCTLIIGIFIFVVAVFGTDLVRKVASVLSVCIIAGLLIVYIPNIIAGAGQIADTASRMTANGGSFGKALYSAFIYGTFQLANVAVFVQHAKSFEKPDDAVQSMGIGWIINALMMIMVVLGIMTVCTQPEMSEASVPTLFMVQCGVGKGFMMPLISVLIILGAVSTAVNMVAAMVKRICSGLDKMKKETGTDEKRKIGTKEIVAAFICCVVDFGIAQFWLLTLIQKAYSVLAYLAIPVILIPYLIHMAVTRFDTK